MSGIVKGAKKAFKSAGKWVKKNWKTVVAAVAVYYTAGVALSSFESTAGLAQAMPGFGTNGLFSKAAVTMGFNGAAGSGISGTTGWFGTTGGGVGAAMAGSSAAGGAVPGVGPAAAAAKAGGAGAATTASSSTTMLGSVGPAAGGGMSSFEKMMMLKSGVDLAAGLLAPSAAEAAAPRQFYGLNDRGEGPGASFRWNAEQGMFEPGAQESMPGSPLGTRSQAPAPMAGASPARAPRAEPVPVASSAPGANFIQGPGPTQMQDDAGLRERRDFISDGYATGNYGGGV